MDSFKFTVLLLAVIGVASAAPKSEAKKSIVSVAAASDVSKLTEVKKPALEEGEKLQASDSFGLGYYHHPYVAPIVEPVVKYPLPLYYYNYYPGYYHSYRHHGYHGYGHYGNFGYHYGVHH